MKFIKFASLSLLPVIMFLCASCDFLDVAPAKRATMEDAMKSKESVESWLGGCYSTVNSICPINFRNYEGSTDEYVTPRLWSEHDLKLITSCNVNATNVPDRYWRILYGEIGNVNLFLRELDLQNPSFLTEADKALYKAHINFLKAYYYFCILNYFGPCPIVDDYVSVSTTKDKFPGRYHYDYVVQYIVDKLDEAYPDLPSDYKLDETYCLANQTVAAALKSRVLLYAASPLWNGEAPWVNWQNTTFETPGYGKELFSKEFSIDKWYKAKDAAIQALEIAKKNGRSLFDMETAIRLATNHDVPWKTSEGGIFLPGVDTETPEGEEFAKKVLQMRYLSASDETEGNKELIFTCISNDYGLAEGKPRQIIKTGAGDDTWAGGWAGLSPTLNILEHFYSKGGMLPEKDPNYTQKSQWFNSAGIEDRPEIINFNVGREPRYYAWISYDGCDLGPRLYNGKPLRLNLRSNAKAAGCSGYDSNTARDNNQTGFLCDKFFSPRTRWTSNSRPWLKYPLPIIRLAELYLNLAESCAEIYMHTGSTEDLQMALDNLNIIRERAGVPSITEKDLTDDMTIRDWARNERTIELYREGHRYYDLRRWVKCKEYLSAGVRKGLNIFVSKKENPSIEEFNKVVDVDGDYRWLDRMYLLPIKSNELYMNPQMVQAPGY
ncbi:MAG: RagB/SusD family nutrient uptake outer membrane protein [Bacteroidales bacterium]|nr:RagB/SusD family nutrient uptake outer membrane protein [Bacteroidales bacterium]MDY6000715.1 RagB/SusD family nutrient uptake outer membrane protein [Candidatus Cryptobacteroides sp.]